MYLVIGSQRAMVALYGIQDFGQAAAMPANGKNIVLV